MDTVESTVLTPGETVDSFLVAGQLLFESVGGDIPETYFAIESGRDEYLLARGDDGEYVSDGASMSELLTVFFEERIPAGKSAYFLELFDIVVVDDGVTASGVEYFLARPPIAIFHAELYFGRGDDLLDVEGGGVPEVDGQIVARSGQHVFVRNVLRCDQRAFMGVHFANKLAVVCVVHFVFVVVFLQCDQKLVEVKHVLYQIIMLLSIHYVL